MPASVDFWATVVLRGGGKLLRTDWSVHESHSVRNSDKTRTKQAPLRDLRAILDMKHSDLQHGGGLSLGFVSTQDDARFVALIRDIKQRDSSTLPTIAKGIKEWRQRWGYHLDREVAAQLCRALISTNATLDSPEVVEHLFMFINPLIVEDTSKRDEDEERNPSDENDEGEEGREEEHMGSQT